jgi:hypothetical protein
VILALSTMDPTVMGIFFLVAVILFVLAAVVVTFERGNIVALGLAFFAFPFMWNAFAAS